MPTVKQLLTEAKKLPKVDRHELAVRIFDTVESPFTDPESDAAWAKEIKKRLEESRSGKVKSYTWEQVEREIDKVLEKVSAVHDSGKRTARNTANHRVVSRRAAQRLRRKIRQAIIDISDYPDRYPKYLFGTRSYKIDRFPLLIVYHYDGYSGEVLALAHAKRRPGYWQRRLK
jgi:putative addiction module component (TIGR02574 family)